MSVRCIGRVFEESGRVGTELLMLLALADHANDDGTCYPSVDGLAEKCRVSARHANRLLAALRDSGEISITINAGPKGKNLYRLNFDRMTPSSPLTCRSSLTCMSSPDESVTLTPTSGGGDVHVPKPLTPTSPEPSLNRQEPSGRVRARKAKLTSLPASFGISDGVKAWAQQKGFGDLEAHLEHFTTKAQAKGYINADWDAAFKGAIRDDWAGLRKGPFTTATITKTADAKPACATKAGFSNRFDA